MTRLFGQTYNQEGVILFRLLRVQALFAIFFFRSDFHRPRGFGFRVMVRRAESWIMLTNFSKILAVAIAIVSVGALGAVLVVAAGGPNWQAEANGLKDYEFTRNDGEVTTWTSKTRRPRPQQGGGAPAPVTVANSVPTLPDAIIKAYEQTIKERNDEKAILDRDIPIYQARIKEASELIQKDLAALKKKEELLVAEKTAQSDAIDKIGKDNIARSKEIQSVRDELNKRRDDVYRLKNELDALRADRFRLVEQQKQLQDLLVRMNGSNDRLERREAQLEAMGATDPQYDEKTKSETPAEQN